MPKKIHFTIFDLLNDAENAMENRSPFSALALTFACISECANIEYPDIWFKQNANKDRYMKTHFPGHYKENGKYDFEHHYSHDKERFVMWVDDLESAHNYKGDIAAMESYSVFKANRKSPQLDGDMLYQIRCSLLHEGSNDIDFSNKNKIKDERNQKIQDFAFTLEDPDPLGIYSLSLSSLVGSSGTSLKITINGIVNSYIGYVRDYLEEHQDKIEQFKPIKVYDNRKNTK